MPAPERIPSRGLTEAGLRTLLTEGELTVLGQVRGASNAVLYCTVAHEGEERTCVYKPVAGEADVAIKLAAEFIARLPHERLSPR